MLYHYSIDVEKVSLFESVFTLEKEGVTVSFSYDFLDKTESLALSILFSFDPSRAASPYWKYEDWDCIVAESQQ
jgi:hypothetical protein